MRTNLAAMVSVVSALACLTAPRAAPAAPAPHSLTLYGYGLFSPELFAANDHSGSSWGAGGGIRWGLNDRWELGLDASSIGIDGTVVRPLTVGFVFGTGGSARWRPWIEGGIGYYELNATRADFILRGWSSAGNPRDFQERARVIDLRDAGGGYFGLGLDWRISGSLALSAGARTHTWIPFTQGPIRFGNWDGMAAVRSGLSYRF
jgi:hypothetical protein